MFLIFEPTSVRTRRSNPIYVFESLNYIGKSVILLSYLSMQFQVALFCYLEFEPRPEHDSNFWTSSKLDRRSNNCAGRRHTLPSLSYQAILSTDGIVINVSDTICNFGLPIRISARVCDIVTIMYISHFFFQYLFCLSLLFKFIECIMNFNWYASFFHFFTVPKSI